MTMQVNKKNWVCNDCFFVFDKPEKYNYWGEILLQYPDCGSEDIMRQRRVK